jgi:UDP-glucose 4-epimerase
MIARPLAVVTGGAGFIGSHMVDLLVARGFEVRVIDNLVGGRLENLAEHRGGPVTLDQLDIRALDATTNPFEGTKFVFHFAGIGDIVPSIERPVDYMSTNVLGTVRVLECARAAGVEKLVYAASSSCYGLADVPTGEDHPLRPQ